MFTLNTTEVHAVCYGISSYHYNAMLSDNPESGIYVADTARTLDENCNNPACNQGGVLVLEIRRDISYETNLCAGESSERFPDKDQE